ncbi:hypothetical protein RND71_026616 [Anisodus tanguticus]|uniref:Galactose oxidase n=1 Tax=Anisodus tanguticus TaxID=243964 RepID=A0AAE1RP79_9SOLA|nr:hypothetical protein RND71_026616 [Anisodus tanguticus]
MHMQLLNNDRVVMYDRTDFGASNISLPNGKCRNNPNDLALKVDCTAHSVEYDVSTNSIRPLMVQTDVWCSSGSATSDGTLVQTGGFNDGKHMNLRAETVQAEVLVCGGAPRGSYPRAAKGDFVGALNTCGRITITDPNPQWTMETMPLARTMGDMVILPNGNVLIINGAASGTAGWQISRNPVLSPVIYRPDSPFDSRFEVQNPNTIPRMYHSTTVLLRDGRVLVGGSNPNEFYNFTSVLFPTDLSLEEFSPSYLDAESVNLRPQIISPASHLRFTYGQRVDIQFTTSGLLNRYLIKVTMVAPGFNTHSNTMNQRMLVLPRGIVRQVRKSAYLMSCVFPRSGKLAPPGYYLLFVVHQDIPSEAIWVRVN